MNFFRRLSRLIAAVPAAILGPLQSLRKNRALLAILVKRDFAIRTSETLLGGFWLILQPALQVFALWFLLDFVLRVRMPAADASFANYLLVGMIPWLFIAETLNRALAVLREFAPLYQRTRFPLELLPLLPALLSTMIYGAIYFLVLAFLQGPLAALFGLLAIPVLALLLMPLSYLFAVTGLFIPDLGKIVTFLLTLAFYLTPILYTPEMLPEAARGFLVLNPLADVIAVIQGLVLGLPFLGGQLGASDYPLGTVACAVLAVVPPFRATHAGSPLMTIRLRGAGKSYAIYPRPIDRLKEVITRRFHHEVFDALKPIDLEIEPGDVVGVIGRNGAGKSTLLKLIAGTLQPSVGDVIVNGQVSALLELGTGFHPDMSGRDNVF